MSDEVIDLADSDDEPLATSSDAPMIVDDDIEMQAAIAMSLKQSPGAAGLKRKRQMVKSEKKAKRADTSTMDFDEVQIVDENQDPQIAGGQDEEMENEDEDGICIVPSRNAAQNPMISMPHTRFQCQKFPFKNGNTITFCPKCFCYVCDVEAKDCKQWATHHRATDEGPMASHWRELRQQQKAGTAGGSSGPPSAGRPGGCPQLVNSWHNCGQQCRHYYSTQSDLNAAIHRQQAVREREQQRRQEERAQRELERLQRQREERERAQTTLKAANSAKPPKQALAAKCSLCPSWHDCESSHSRFVGMGVARRMEKFQYKTLGVVQIPVTYAASVMSKSKRDVYDQTKQRWCSSWVDGLPRTHNHCLWKATSTAGGYGNQALHQLECLDLDENPPLARVVLHMQRKWLILDDKTKAADQPKREGPKLAHMALLEALAEGDKDPSQTGNIPFLRGKVRVLRQSTPNKAILEVTAQLRWGDGPAADLIWADNQVSQYQEQLGMIMSAIYTKPPADHLGFTQTAGEILQRRQALSKKMSKVGGSSCIGGARLAKLLQFMETDQEKCREAGTMEDRLMKIANTHLKTKAGRKEKGSEHAKTDSELLQLVRDTLAEYPGKEYKLLATVRKTPAALFTDSAAKSGKGSKVAKVDAKRAHSGFGKEWECTKCGNINDGSSTMLCTHLRPSIARAVGDPMVSPRSQCGESAPASVPLEHILNIPHLPIGDPLRLVNRRIEVMFTMKRHNTSKWFAGTVAEFDPQKGKSGEGQHRIQYDDGDTKWHSLKIKVGTGSFQAHTTVLIVNLYKY
jgi:hypothetical protein